ncbi:MAG: class I SAM-dependent methyltransferase [Pseudomonadota bacterium]
MHDRAQDGWDALYADGKVQQLPWYYEALDPDVEAALGRRALASGHALDLGCGPGTQSLHLVRHGFEVTASDISGAAVLHTERLASEQGLTLHGVVDDILHSQLTGPFDLVVDRGCFHVLPPGRRSHYVDTMARILAPAGVLLLKCFSEKQPGTTGPYRLSPTELREAFASHLDTASVERTVYQGTTRPPPHALFAEFQRGVRRP